jgi:hypothetical protein
MDKPIGQLIDEYARWLRGGITVEQIGDAYEVTTPFLDRHNDHIQIYVRQENRRLLLTDDGYVLADLRQSGCTLESQRRQALLKSILGGFGVALSGDELTTVAHNGDFPQRKHALIQAMLAVGDLFATAKSHVQSLFLEDVAAYLDSIQARYVPSVQFVGKSGFQHKYDFAIPKSAAAPERLVRAINHPSKNNAELAIFAWTDTRAVRDDAAQMYAILNDSETHVAGEVADALKQYDIVPVTWSERQRYQQALAA